MKAKVCYQPTLMESLDSYIEYAAKTKRFADVGFYEKLKAQLEKYQSEAAELPAEFNCEPAADYDNLRKQFLAMQRIANSLSAQNNYLRRRDDSDMRAALSVNAANVSAERDTNAMLTDLLERAEAERDALKVNLGLLLDAADHLGDDMRKLMESSAGVAGLHLNGEIALWDDLCEGRRLCEWLGSLDTLYAAIRAVRSSLAGDA